MRSLRPVRPLIRTPAPHALARSPTSKSDRGAGAGASPERVDENPLALLAGLVAQLATASGRPAPSRLSLWQARDDWLRRLQTTQRSASALTAYRIAIDDLLNWNAERARNVFEEATIVASSRPTRRASNPRPRPTAVASDCCAGSSAG